MTHSNFHKTDIAKLEGLLSKLSSFSVLSKSDGRLVCLSRIRFKSVCGIMDAAELPTDSAIIEENVVEGLSPTPEMAELLATMFQLMPKMLSEVIRLRKIIESAPSIWDVDYLNEEYFAECLQLIEKATKIMTEDKKCDHKWVYAVKRARKCLSCHIEQIRNEATGRWEIVN